MRFLALITLLVTLVARGDWKTTKTLYWYAGGQPGVALTSSNILGCEHASGSYTSVQIGDITGVLGGLCTGFVTDGVCGGSVQNCQWGRPYRNSTNDIFNFRTCRPVTSGISYIATNLLASTAVTWYSLVDLTWYIGTINLAPTGQLFTFPDGETGWYQVYFITGHTPVSGDSGSPIFTEPNGDCAGLIVGIDGSDAVAKLLWPSGAQTRPLSSPSFSAGLVQLFNSDPDQ